MKMKEEMLVIENGGISKEGNDIFRELYIQIYKGEIFGIIFDNILEKKCLLDFIKGKMTLDSGRIYLNGEKIDPKESTGLFTDFIAVIERTSKLVNSLSIVDNVLMFAPFMPKYITDKKTYTNTMGKVKKELHVNIRTDKPVLNLTSKERAIIELIKAYVEGKKLVVMANVAGFLKSKEFAEIFSFIGEDEPEKQQPALVFDGINTEILNNFNFCINKGEVIKIYYMDDSSLIHIVELLKGKRKPLSGRIAVSNKEYRVNDTHKAVNKGVCFVEESPYENMLFYNMSILDNLCLALAKKVPLIWIKKRYTKSVQELVSQYMDDDITNIRLSRLPPVKLQQIAYLKWLLYAPSVVVCIKPFTEVDIHLREVTVNMIEMLRMRGIAVIIFTPNFSETYQIDGKTIYIRNGRLIDEDEVYQILYREG